MPAEPASIDSTQGQQADKVSAVTQKYSSDVQQNTTAFSYAQAAKGRSPSTHSAPTPEVNPSIMEMNGKKALLSEIGVTTPESDQDTAGRTTAEGREPQGENPQDSQEGTVTLPSDKKDTMSDTPHGSNSEAAKTESILEKPTVAGQSQPAASTPSSPEYGMTSTSTLPKEDDMFSTTNGSSDSTSDKQSQTSQNGNRLNEKADVEKGHNTSTVWEEDVHAPAPALIEAAPPPVNIWLLRSQNQAKAKASVLSQPVKPINLANPAGNTNSPGKGNEPNAEPKNKDSRKKPKVASGHTDERSSAGFGKESVKSADVVEKNGLGAVAPPPPPGDAVSWPKPDSAIGDGKKKNPDRAEKSEKDTAQVSKPHGKEKWVPVPYVPTAVFSTPLPQARRGGRGPTRGGREADNRGRNNATIGHGSEKPTVVGAGTGQTNATGGQDRSRPALTSGPTNSHASKNKRASSAGPSTPREQRKPGDISAPEKRKDIDGVTPKAVAPNNNHLDTSRRPSVPTMMRDSQAVQSSPGEQPNEPSWISTVIENDADGHNKTRNEVSETYGQPRAGHERRSEASVRSPEFARDFQGSNSTRERSDVRDRGRGGFRGRGGGNHSFFSSNMPNGHGYSNGYQSQYQSSTGSPSKSQSNHDRLSAQAQGSTFQQTHHQPRHYRHNSRSQSIPHSQYGRFANGQHGGPPHLANLQTDLANEYGYLPAHQGAMSAMPFSSYGEQPSVFGMVNLQMNYYFSVENLCKDLYLRSHMDSQGFVFLDLLAQFNRIRQLTNDMDLIRLACHHSQTIEYVNVDGIDRVRAREGWQQWVRKMEERDPSARNDGPPLQDFSQYPQSFNYIAQPEERQVVSPGSNATGSVTDNIQYQPLNGFVPSIGQTSNGTEPNGINASTGKTPLSAAVSEFSPSSRSSKSRNFSTADNHTQGTSVFTDAQVENLRILVRKPSNAPASVPPPFHTSSSRTFSNGSIDGRSINDELSKFAERQAKPTVNGDASESVESHNVERSRSPFPVNSPSRSSDNNVSPPVLWSKDRQNDVDPLKSITDDCTDESYHVFRQDALKHREQSGSGKDHYNMQSLYQFWSHFLVRNFNARMYEEFHRLALEDVDQRESTIGMRSLLRFYDESVLSQKAVSDDHVARDFIDLVKAESSKSERPIFAKLRAVWRNGAFNMRNRSKLTKFVNTDLKTQLEH